MCAMHCKIILARLQPEINLDHKMDFDQPTSFPEGHLYISLTECLLTVAHCPFKWIELSWTVQQNKMHWAQKTLKVEKYLRKVNWTSPYWGFMFIAYYFSQGHGSYFFFLVASKILCQILWICWIFPLLLSTLFDIWKIQQELCVPRQTLWCTHILGVSHAEQGQ
jgi:hypothetical protein